MNYVRFVAFLACTLLVSSAAHAAEIRTVALSGQHAPGTPDGTNFLNVSPPVLNDAGQTAFVAGLIGAGVNGTNSPGIWSEASGSLALVARRGDHAPGTPSGVNFGAAFSLQLNDVGQIAFYASLVGNGVNSSNDDSFWSEGSGSLAPVARQGDQASGVPNGVSFGALRPSIALNNAGETAFLGNLSGSGVDSTNGSGIWAGKFDSLTLVARSGDSAPGAPSGVNFQFNSGTSTPVLNDGGQIAFHSPLTSGDTGIWSEGSGNLALVARTGEHAPGAPSGANFSSFSSGSTRLNNAGQTAFVALLTDVSAGIWSEGSGSLRLVARSGDQAPGLPPGVNFGQPGTSVVLNDAGHTAFWARLAESSGATIGDGIWSECSGTLALVAQAGEHAPGTPDGVNFANLFNSQSSLVLNDGGQIAFLADLSDISRGIWATDRNGDLQLIVREGDLLEVAPGDFRMIHGFGEFGSDGIGFAANTGNSDGRASGFNNCGQLAFWARFTDGTFGIFVSNRVAVPEPSTLLLLGFGSLAVLRWRRVLVCASVLAAFVCAAASVQAADIRTVALSGHQAPGTPEGVNFRLGSADPVINDAGQTAFLADLQGGVVFLTNDLGIWSEGTGSLALVARSGDHAAGTPSNVNYSRSLPRMRPVLNNSGQTAFVAGLTGSGCRCGNE